MITVAFVLCLAIAFEGLVFYAGRVERRTRAERAYWAAKRTAPDLYDWAKELDL